MSQFCSGMRTQFSNFLTIDDGLAARHAVLLRRTNFYSLANLHGAANCESDTEVTSLKTLNSHFEFPPIARTTNDDRSPFVQNRGNKMLIPALLLANKDALTGIVADPTKFTFAVAKDVTNAFPDPPTGVKTWGDITGTAAIDQLVQAGSFRTGCWSALPAQNLRNLIGVALNKKTGNSSGILVEFNADYPGPGVDPATDKGKVSKITFLSISTVQTVTGLADWPGATCQLV